MSDALVGYTGFVGGAMLRARSFDACFRSTDIDLIRGRQFALVVCCGAPAEKWRANRDPEEDRARLATLTDALAEVRAERLVLVSTVDVYPQRSGVDEDTHIDPHAGEPYGRHRLALEAFCRARFVTTVVRLPGLYGQGLRKNAVYELLHDRSVDAIAGNARFQFYDVDRVWSDVERVLAAGADTANITSEPVAMSDVASRVFNRTLPTQWSDSAPSYDVRSRYAYLVHGDNGYWFDAATVYDGLQRFVAHERGA